MGVPSITILLHEITKLLDYAGCEDVSYFRIGTSGGVGVDPGTVVITSEAVDGLLRPNLELHINGERVYRPSTANSNFIADVKNCADRMELRYNVVVAKTMCADDFYEAQSRLDGAICEMDEDQKSGFLNKLYEYGIRNIEMECLAFQAFCRKLKINGAVVCVTLLNRLELDQIMSTKEMLLEFQLRPAKVVIEYIKQKMKEA